MTPTVRRSAPSSRTPGSSATASTWSAAPTPRWTRSAANASARPAPAGRRAPDAAAAARVWRPELYHARHRLLKARERLTGRDRRRLSELFAHDPIVAEAWALKEGFRAVYHASDRADAERRLDHFLGAVDRAQLPAFAAFANGIELWREELLAYFDEPTTNGYAEGVINKVKVIKRRAYGLPTFNGFRDRVLLACG
jgi:transposase